MYIKIIVSFLKVILYIIKAKKTVNIFIKSRYYRV